MGWGGQPHAPSASTPLKGPVPIVQEAWWVPGPVWTDGKFRPHRDSIPGPPSPCSVTILTELPAHRLGSERCKLRLLLSQSSLLNTTFWQIHFPGNKFSVSFHLRLFALLQFAHALKFQEGAQPALLKISCYLCCSVVICVVLCIVCVGRVAQSV